MEYRNKADAKFGLRFARRFAVGNYGNIKLISCVLTALRLSWSHALHFDAWSVGPNLFYAGHHDVRNVGPNLFYAGHHDVRNVEQNLFRAGHHDVRNALKVRSCGRHPA
jgi:hypothetical protein